MFKTRKIVPIVNLRSEKNKCSIHLFSSAYPIHSCDRTGAYSGCHRANDGAHFGQVTSLSLGCCRETFSLGSNILTIQYLLNLGLTSFRKTMLSMPNVIVHIFHGHSCVVTVCGRLKTLFKREVHELLYADEIQCRAQMGKRF